MVTFKFKVLLEIEWPFSFKLRDKYKNYERLVYIFTFGGCVPSRHWMFGWPGGFGSV
jgi:hypothetical protein